ncbi:hypothetical protein K492DRAFT_174636 [Lichtheimia hyalospora FSU 10163]|nr:hypothetical protein K492DRAFT_174636 [Lichtheimia hyalospora FSU 10163]
MDFVTTRNRFDLGSSYGCYCHVSFQCSTWKQLSATHVLYLCIITATRGVIGAVAFFSLVDINLHALVLNPWMFSHHAYIFLCTIESRPGLFVPTLFVMHDVSLTPARKVA